RLAPVLEDPAMGVAGLHIYTFNQIKDTEIWRRKQVAALGGAEEVTSLQSASRRAVAAGEAARGMGPPSGPPPPGTAYRWATVRLSVRESSPASSDRSWPSFSW